MRPASVGFHCPECVAEGARSTRSGRTAYGGRLSRNPALTSYVLIAVNAVIWALINATGGSNGGLYNRLVLLPKGAKFQFPNGNLHYIEGVADGAYWQLVTSVFSQQALLHFGFNMVMLFVLGPQLELALGRARFLAVFLLSGLTGSAVVYWLSPEYGQTLGASGAIFGLMGALLVLALKVGGDYSQLLVLIGINFVFTVVGRGSISWQGHLGGFLGGVLLAALLAYAPRQRRTFWQVLALSAYALILLLAIVTRTAVLT